MNTNQFLETENKNCSRTLIILEKTGIKTIILNTKVNSENVFPYICDTQGAIKKTIAAGMRVVIIEIKTAFLRTDDLEPDSFLEKYDKITFRKTVGINNKTTYHCIAAE